MLIEKIYIDLDQVLADFDKKKEELKLIHPSMAKNDEEFWKGINSVDNFFSTLDKMVDADELMAHLNSLSIPLSILTALPRKSTMPTARKDKREWIKRHISEELDFIAVYAARNKQLYANPTHLLIDDKTSNIDEWRAKGGIAIQHVSAEVTISKLDRLLCL